MVEGKVIYADEFTIKDVYFGQLENKKFKSVKLQINQDDARLPKFQIGKQNGWIPTYSVKRSEKFGTFSVSFTLPDPSEKKAIRKFQKDAVEFVVKNKDKFWPGKNIPDDLIRHGFNPILMEGKDNPKKPGDKFDDSIQTKLPQDKEGNLIDVEVIEHDGTPISIHDVPGRKYKGVVIELRMIYFQGKTDWGFSKAVSQIQLAKDGFAIKEKVTMLPQREVTTETSIVEPPKPEVKKRKVEASIADVTQGPTKKKKS